MNLSQIHYFIAIAETGYLSEASKQLKVSQPALSKYLIKLEQEVGLELFYREKKRLKPTRAGRLYLDAAYKIVGIRQQARASIMALNNTEEKKTIMLGVTPHQGAQLVARLYPAFKRRFPQTEFVLQEGYTGKIYEDLRQGKTQYGITSVLSNAEGLRLIPLFEEELVLSVPAFHNLAHLSSGDPEQMREIDIAEFRDSPFVLMDRTTSIGEASSAAFARAGFQPTVLFQSANGYIVDQMIRFGMGVGPIPYHYAVPSTEVVYFKLRERCAFCCCAAVRKGHVLSEEERYFTYLQFKKVEYNEYVRLCRNDELRKIVTEFGTTGEWDSL